MNWIKKAVATSALVLASCSSEVLFEGNISPVEFPGNVSSTVEYGACVRLTRSGVFIDRNVLELKGYLIPENKICYAKAVDWGANGTVEESFMNCVGDSVHDTIRNRFDGQGQYDVFMDWIESIKLDGLDKGLDKCDF